MTRPTVGIVTLVDHQNYGNRLQNYAVTRLLRDRGLDPITVEVTSSRARTRVRDAYYSTARDLRVGGVIAGRSQAFLRFSRAHIPRLAVRASELGTLERHFDFFVIGSDQVWNPNDSRLGGLVNGFQCLAGIAHDRKIALSPSFGITELNPMWQERYAEWLTGFAQVSVREASGADLVRDLTGRRPIELVDPTMAIEPEHWSALGSKASMPRRPYLVQMFLGASPPERVRRLNEFAAKHDLVVVDLSDPRDDVARLTGPSEFIGLIEGASAVATDSFHCAVFSLLLDSSLLLFERTGKGKAMGSRLTTLVECFGLEERFIQDELMPLRQELISHDYGAAAGPLVSRRDELAGYLDSELARVGHARTEVAS